MILIIINKEQKQISKEPFSFIHGIFQFKDNISPSCIQLQNPGLIQIEETYYSTILIVNYYREITDLLLKNIIDSNINMNISMFYEKQDTYKIIRELTYHIGNVGVDLKEKNQNRQDIDLVAFTYNDAKYIRKEMQVNNEELYFLYLYITVFSKDKKELEYLLNKVEGLVQSKGMQNRRAYFRQEQAWISCIPAMQNHVDVKQVTRRNVLTSGLIATYPFISSSLFEEQGIFIGTNIYNDSLIFINRYNTQKYKNANMCVFGTSGAGKSFYIKTLIIRNSIFDIEQYVIDPDREYTNICKTLGGTLIQIGPTSKTYVNILDIRKESIEENNEGYLATKIGRLIGFFNLIFGQLKEEEKGILEEKIVQCYNEKQITFEDSSLYEKGKFKTSKDMPILEDLYEILKKDEKTKSMAIKLTPFIKGSLQFFNQHTNIALNNTLIIADVYELGEENLKYGIYLFTEFFWDKIKNNRNKKKAIYLDEIWRLIGVTSNSHVASFIYKIFKTIRKYGGSAVAITQDVSDLFGLDAGTYGKSILNNSSIKAFFSLEEENIKILSNYTNLSEKEKIEIATLKRGEALIFAGNDHILAKIEVSEFEKEIIEESD